jgi:predicted ATPase
MPYLNSCTFDREKVDNWNKYPFSLAAFKNLNHLRFKSEVTFFVGENGSGKSTLLQALAVHFGCNYDGGSRNFRFKRPIYFDPDESGIPISKNIMADYISSKKQSPHPNDCFYFRADSFGILASEIEKIDFESHYPKIHQPSHFPKIKRPPILNSYGGKSLHHQSHGESFLSFLTNRVGRGLYFFDEPESALSPSRQMTLLRILFDRVNAGSQFIIATHSPILLSYPNAEIFHFNENGIFPISYKETEHYDLTLRFLSNPQKYLGLLLSDDEF